MKIKLTAEEIGAILVNWAKQKYKTHNISAEFKDNEAELEVVMTNDQITDAPSDITDMAIYKARQRIMDGSVEGFKPNTPDDQPDFSGAFDALVTPLA